MVQPTKQVLVSAIATSASLVLLSGILARQSAGSTVGDAPAYSQSAADSRARSAVIRAAVRRVAPAVVTIETVGGAQPVAPPSASAPTMPGEAPRPQQAPPGRRRAPSGGFRVADGATTGLVWSADGWIISSSFNFVRNPTITTVLVPNVASDGTAGAPPTRYVAKLVARDYIRRIALLKIDAAGLSAPEWIGPDVSRPGQTAVACGRGLGPWLAAAEGDASVPSWFPSISVGIISATGRRNGNAVQTDAKTSPVNYGGPLVDLDGRVHGLIVPLAGAGEEMAGLEWYDGGIGFAVTRASIDRVIDRLMRGENIEAGRMGVTVGDDDDGRCKIQAIADPSPALSCGVMKDDIIVGLNGQAVGGRDELLRRISDQAAGERITLRIERGGQSMEFSMMLARPKDLGQIDPDEESPAKPPPATQPDDDDN